MVCAVPAERISSASADTWYCPFFIQQKAGSCSSGFLFELIVDACCALCRPCCYRLRFAIILGMYIGDLDDRERITRNPAVMGGKPCIRGLRVTVGMVVGLLATGRSVPEILLAYPYLEESDVRAALAYAAWRSEEFDIALAKRAS